MASVSDILANQKQLAAAIETVYTNFKKDGASRKTAEYVKKRLDLLDSYWFEYEANVTRLMVKELDANTRELINKEREQMNERYVTIKTHIQSCHKSVEEKLQSPAIEPPAFPVKSQSKPQPSTTTSQCSSIVVTKTEEMLRKQQSNFKAFHRTVTGIRLDAVNERWEFEDLLRTVQSRWSAIDSLHWELDSLLDGTNDEYEKSYSSYEGKYQAVKKAINQKMWSVAHMEKSTPQLEIPTFSGNYNAWVSFKDLFKETIHKNNAMSSAQKMQYLKAKVRGEAERLIQHLNVSSDNYTVCWDILNQRYNNNNLIFQSHMNTFMNIPSMQQQSATLLKRMHDTTQECLNAIKNLGVDISSWDPIIVYILSQKLDTASFTDYRESTQNPRELPCLKEFLYFVESKFTSLESSRRKQDNPSQKPLLNNKNSPNNNFKPNFHKTSFTSSKINSLMSSNKNNLVSKFKCPMCYSNDHGIYYCQLFLEMQPEMRLKTINKLNLCISCLSNHQGKKCSSNKSCSDCNKNHNRLLHEAFAQPQYTRLAMEVGHGGEGSIARGVNLADVSENASSGKYVQRSSHVSIQDDPYEVLLPTAMIKVQAADGSFYVMRALLDQGSQTSLITEHAAQLLKIPRQKCKGIVSGIGDKASNSKGIVSLHCCSMGNDFTFETDALIMKQLIKNLPTYTFGEPDWSYLNHIKLADPEFYKSRPVDILFGADIYSTVLMDGICRANSSLPTAQQTRLGWILSGNTRTFHCNVILHNMQDIQKFWEIEDISEQSDLSLEDKQCIEYYKSTTVRRQDGRYEVRLPLKPDFEEKLGCSRSKAVAQFYKLEQKILALNSSVASDYREFIAEYLSLGHMTPSTSVDNLNNRRKCYLPHHCVTRSDSTTTKLRVVFNASSKTSSGLSLNDVMFRGPNLQQDLQSLLLIWRQYKYAFTADIEKMFRQIWINKDDQYLQMIVWRDNPRKQLKDYRSATISYGTKAAPFLAMMTLKQLAHDEKMNYQDSSAPRVLEECFYMDDLIHGAHTLSSARQLQTDMIQLLKSGGFHLRKWKSNSLELLEHVSESGRQEEHFDFKQGESIKALGLGWNPKSDFFTLQAKLPSSSKLTKRSLLSDMSKIFDPLGWLSPLTIKLKILFQEVWKLKIEWDEAVPHDISEEWYKIKQDIDTVSQFQVPRWLQTQESDQVELHGFCDASTKAYGCVVYCKISRLDSISIVLVAGKTKLVPLSKTCSLPRLELCSAVLLSKLMTKIKNCLLNYEVTIYGWVDSMAVLGWLNGRADRWKPFVANRVKQVTVSMPSVCWRYVASKENPADCASRGLTATQLLEHTLWWQGPGWLPTYIPENESKQNYSTDQDLKNVKQVNVILSSNEIIKQLIDKHSSLNRAVRILAWVLRFGTKNRKLGNLSIQELSRAKNLIIRECQAEYFSQDIYRIKEGKGGSKDSKILNLNPILDENGILRVGGRLRHANIDKEMMHPAIIPSNTRLADLIIDQAHELTYHGGARLTTSFIRRKYWLIGGNNATKKRLRLCIRCKRQDPDLMHQIMGDLPLARSNPSRPFYHCGVDYTGHVTVKASKGRGIKTTKGYIAVFVCMATKAVHLELVSDLTTSAFLAALRRMAARRGVPGHIYSDQGKNFVGANNVLKLQLAEIQETINDEFRAEVASMGIEFHLSCPSWPSAGGIWESAVRSLKHHLKRVIGEQNLTYEEFTTLLSQLEGCLNSRPLCPLTEDPDDLNFLTPSHFLSSGPVLTLYNTETDLRTRWYLTQKIFNDIWNRWREEYLTSLTTRSKWREPKTSIKLDDVVIIKDDNLPPGRWSLGRVTELHPGSDGYVRVVTLKTKHGLLKRPVVKLCRLPLNNDSKLKTDEEINSPIKQKLLQPPRKSKAYSFATTAISLLIFFMIMSVGHCAHNITSLQGNNSIYFDRIKDMQIIRDDWRLVVYYDTRPYLEGYKAINKHIKYLDNLCEKIQARSHCDGVLLQLRHEVDEIQYYNNILMNHNVNNNVRKRRGLINGVGYVANSLFGVLDDRFAQKYERDIDLIRKNQNHLASLWKNQTSVVEAEFNLLKRTETVIEESHKLIHMKLNALETFVNQIKTEVENASLLNDFLTTAMLTNTMIFSLKSVQQTLLGAITNIYNGKFDFHLLMPDQLSRELGIIAERLPKDLSLPVKRTDTLSQIYNLLEVRARVTSNFRFIIFEITVPLIDQNVYEILRTIPVPRVAEGGREVAMVPVADYVAVNLKHDSFIKLSESDLRACLEPSHQLCLCHLKKSIHIIKDDQSFCETLPNLRKCDTVTTICKNRWETLSGINRFFYFCCATCNLKLVCDDKITPLQLSKSGIFNIDQGCIIKLPDSFTYSHRHDESKITLTANIPSPQISQINYIINISLPHSHLNYTEFSLNDTVQLQEIQRNLEIKKTTEPVASEISYHDIHHYAAIYVLFTIVGVGGAIWLCRCVRRKLASARGTGRGPLPAPAATCTSERLTTTSEVQSEAALPKVQSVKIELKDSKSSPNAGRSRFSVPDIDNSTF